MKAREIVVTLVALLAIGVTSFFAYRYEQKARERRACARSATAWCIPLPPTA